MSDGAKPPRDAAMRDSDRLFDAVFEQAGVGMALVAPDGRFLRVNDKLCEIVGYTREELLARTFQQITHPDDLSADLAQTRRLFAGELPDFTLEKRYLRKDGNVIWVALTVSLPREPGGAAPFSVSAMQGISDRKRAEAQAESARVQLSQVFERVSDAFVALDKDWRYTYVNARAGEMFGRPPEELIGKHIWTEFPEGVGQPFHLAYERAMREQKPMRFEDYYAPWDRWFENIVYPSADGLSIYFHDISDRKRSERALQRALRALRTRSECSQALMHATEEGALLYEVCRILIEFGEYRLVWVGMAVDDAARSVQAVAAAGADAGYVDSLRVSWADDDYGRGPTGTAIREQRPAVARDLATDPRFAKWRQAAIARGFASSLALPLLPGQAKCIGALNLYATEVDAFDGDEVAFLAELAADLARAVGALRDRSARALAEQRTQRAAQRMTQLLGASNVIVYSLRVVDGQLVPRDVSENVERLLGYRITEALVDGWWYGHVHPADRPLIAADNAKLFAEAQLTRVYRFAHKDGRYLWIQDDQRVVSDAEGRPHEVVGTWTDVSGRMQAEQAVRDSEAQLRLALEAAQQGIYDLNVQTGDAQVSAEYATMLGFDPATFRETNAAWIERLHPDDREPVGATFRNYISGKIRSYRVEFRQRTAGGDWKWILSIGRVVERDASGAPLRMLGTHTDISDRKVAEEALRSSEQRYRQMFEANPQPMWVYDLATLRFLAVNDAAVAKYGFSRAEFLAMTIKDIRPAEDVPRLLANVAAVRDGLDEAGVWRHRTRDGRELRVEISSHVLNFDGRRAEVVLANDVTERLRAEAERRAATERFETLFRNAPESISISELASGRFVQVNEAFCAMFGYSAHELIGRTALELNLWSSAERRAQVLDELRAGRRVLAEAGQARTRAGEQRDTLFSAVRLDFGGRECLLIMLVDVSERVRAQQQVAAHEQQLKELARRLLTKEEEERKALAQTLHDHFAQNLAAAKLGLEGALLRGGRADRAVAIELPQTLQRVIASLDESISDVRGLLAELRPPLLAEFGLPAALRHEVEGRRSLGAGVEITLHVDRADAEAWPGVRLAPTTEYSLFMIAREALANALLHARARHVDVELQTDGAQVLIRVRDDGTGFDPERLNAPGHLGLTGMRERAALAGARLQIETEIGKGTMVFVASSAGSEQRVEQRQ